MQRLVLAKIPHPFVSGFDCRVIAIWPLEEVTDALLRFVLTRARLALLFLVPDNGNETVPGKDHCTISKLSAP